MKIVWGERSTMFRRLLIAAAIGAVSILTRAKPAAPILAKPTSVSLVAISAMFGLERLDRFEVVVISIDWLVLIVNGVLLSILFRRQRGDGA